MALLSLALGSLILSLVYLAVRHVLPHPANPRANFPPGPPALPFLGNLHQIQLTKPFLQFAEWGRTHGAHGLVGLRLGPSSRAVVVNSWRAARDLLDRRGAVYSSRPYVPIVEYVVPPPGDIHLVFMPYGPKWRKARRTVTDFLRDDEVDRLVPLQDAESSQMMHDLLLLSAPAPSPAPSPAPAPAPAPAPGQYHDHVLRCFGAVVMTSVFGTRGRDFGDEGRIRQFFDCQAEWAGMLDQGAVPPFDVFPFLRHVPDVLTPWRGWRRRAAALKSKQNGLYRDLFREARARVERQGKAGGSFVASLLRNNARDGYSEVELEYITGFLMEGGSDTTAGAFETFVLAMAAYQEVQRRAQAEVDSVFGEDGVRSGQAGADALPYLKACFLETLRWRPGFPLAIPHATTQDDIYQGYHIPANTTILMNIWAISHDPDEYEDPDSFRPERFLDGEFGTASGSREEPNETAEGGPGDQTDSQSQSQSQSQSRRPTYGFGAGRRVCAGQRMAENSMLMTMSKLLWYFDVVVPGGRAPDTGVRTAFKDAILTGPKPFDVGFDVRGERRRGVLVDEWAKADAWLRQFE